MKQRLGDLVERVLAFLDRHNRLRFGAFTYLVALFHLQVILQGEFERGITIKSFEPTNLALVAVSFVSVISLAQALDLLIVPRWPRFVAGGLYVSAYAVLVGYHAITSQTLELSFVRDNMRELVFADARRLIWKSELPAAMAAMAVTWMVGSILEARLRLVTRWQQPRRAHVWGAGFVVAWLACFFAPISTHDELIYFTQTLLQNPEATGTPILPDVIATRGWDASKPYPLVTVPTHVDSAQAPERPDVFIVAMESFNANFVLARTPDGRPLTPNFDGMTQQGRHFPNFWGNSVQSAKGQLAILCSIFPSVRSKVFTDHPNLRLACLPKVLQARGYQTYFATAGNESQYDRTDEFMLRNGFQSLRAMQPENLTDEEKTHVWGWGLQDDWYFRHVFAELDGMAEKNAAPIFAFLATISNHMPFNEMPDDAERLYPKPRNQTERYSNSIHLADKYLPAFLEELRKRPRFRNAVVIFVGDHSYPAGEHGYTHNHVGHKNENFRTPFLLMWEGHLAPQTDPRAASQVDIAPTVLDLLKIETPHHFVGHSLFTSEKPHPVLLVQPYDGRHLGVVAPPWKFVRHVRTHREFLFNLEEDPAEQHNLAGHPEHAATRESLARELSVLELNQTLIEADRVWPASP